MQARSAAIAAQARQALVVAELQQRGAAVIADVATLSASRSGTDGALVLQAAGARLASRMEDISTPVSSDLAARELPRQRREETVDQSPRAFRREETVDQSPRAFRRARTSHQPTSPAPQPRAEVSSRQQVHARHLSASPASAPRRAAHATVPTFREPPTSGAICPAQVLTSVHASWQQALHDLDAAAQQHLAVRSPLTLHRLQEAIALESALSRSARSLAARRDPNVMEQRHFPKLSSLLSLLDDPMGLVTQLTSVTDELRLSRVPPAQWVEAVLVRCFIGATAAADITLRSAIEDQQGQPWDQVCTELRYRFLPDDWLLLCQRAFDAVRGLPVLTLAASFRGALSRLDQELGTQADLDSAGVMLAFRCRLVPAVSVEVTSILTRSQRRHADSWSVLMRICTAAEASVNARKRQSGSSSSKRATDAQRHLPRPTKPTLGAVRAVSSATPTTGASSAPRCKRCRQEGHDVDDCPQPDRRRCFRCGRSGHLSSACSAPARGPPAKRARRE